MAFPKERITFATAASIFSNVSFSKILIGSKVVGYKATIDGETLEDTSITDLCNKVWLKQREKSK
jgi:hypothetical protein